MAESHACLKGRSGSMGSHARCLDRRWAPRCRAARAWTKVWKLTSPEVVLSSAALALRLSSRCSLCITCLTSFCLQFKPNCGSMKISSAAIAVIVPESDALARNAKKYFLFSTIPMLSLKVELNSANTTEPDFVLYAINESLLTSLCHFCSKWFAASDLPGKSPHDEKITFSCSVILSNSGYKHAH